MKKRIGKLNNKILIEGGDLEVLKSNEIKVEKDGDLITGLITRNNNNTETIIGAEYRGIREDLSKEELLKILEKAGYYILDGIPLIPLSPFTIDDETLEIIEKYGVSIDTDSVLMEYVGGVITGGGVDMIFSNTLDSIFNQLIGGQITLVSTGDILYPYVIPFKHIRSVYNISSNDEKDLSINNNLNSYSGLSYYTLPIQASSSINEDGSEIVYFAQNLQEIINILESAYDECVEVFLENYPYDSIFSDSEIISNPDEIPQEDKNVLVKFFKRYLKHMYKGAFKGAYFGDKRLFKSEIMDMIWPKIPASKALNGQWVYDYQTRIEELNH